MVSSTVPSVLRSCAAAAARSSTTSTSTKNRARVTVIYRSLAGKVPPSSTTTTTPTTATMGKKMNETERTTSKPDNNPAPATNDSHVGLDRNVSPPDDGNGPVGGPEKELLSNPLTPRPGTGTEDEDAGSSNKTLWSSPSTRTPHSPAHELPPRLTRRWLVRLNQNQNQKGGETSDRGDGADHDAGRSLVVGTYKMTAAATAEIRDSFGQLILQPPQRRRRSLSSASSASKLHTEDKDSSPFKQHQQQPRDLHDVPFPPLPVDSARLDSPIPPPSPLPPILNVAVWLDPHQYIRSCATATTTRSGTEAARRLVRGRKDWLQAVTKHAQRTPIPGMIQPYRTTGHGIPPQLLHHHMEWADSFVGQMEEYLRAQHLAFPVTRRQASSPTTKSSSSGPSSSLAGRPSLIQSIEFSSFLMSPQSPSPDWMRIRVRDRVTGTERSHTLPFPTTLDQPEEEWSFQLYQTVMERLAKNLAIVLDHLPSPSYVRPLGGRSRAGTSGVSSRATPRTKTTLDEYDNPWSETIHNGHPTAEAVEEEEDYDDDFVVEDENLRGSDSNSRANHANSRWRVPAWHIQLIQRDGCAEKLVDVQNIPVSSLDSDISIRAEPPQPIVEWIWPRQVRIRLEGDRAILIYEATFPTSTDWKVDR